MHFDRGSNLPGQNCELEGRYPTSHLCCALKAMTPPGQGEACGVNMPAADIRPGGFDMIRAEWKTESEELVASFSQPLELGSIDGKPGVARLRTRDRRFSMTSLSHPSYAGGMATSEELVKSILNMLRGGEQGDKTTLLKHFRSVRGLASEDGPPKSLLTPVFGLYHVKLFGEEVTYVLMPDESRGLAESKQFHPDCKNSKMFTLNGETEAEQVDGGNKDFETAFGNRFGLPEEDCLEMTMVFDQDATFLQEHGVAHYSLLAYYAWADGDYIRSCASKPLCYFDDEDALVESAGCYEANANSQASLLSLSIINYFMPLQSVHAAEMPAEDFSAYYHKMTQLVYKACPC